MSGTVSSARVVATESPKASHSEKLIPMAAPTGAEITSPSGEKANEPNQS
jgi:hypothetical protein